MSEDLRKSSCGPPDILIVPSNSEYAIDEIDPDLGKYGRYLDVKEKPHVMNSEMISTGEDSMAHVQDQIETEPFYTGPEDIKSLKAMWATFLPMTELLQSLFTTRVFYSIFDEDTVKTVKHLDRPVPVIEKKNGHKWNMTEDEYDLWVSLDEETTDILIQKCPEKAEVVRGLRSEALKGKAIALPSSSIAPGPTTSSPWRANGIQYQNPYGCGGLVDNQQFDPDGPFVCSATPNQTGNAAATFCVEDEKRFFLTDNGPTPAHILLGYPDQFHSKQVDPANRSVNSSTPNQIGNGAATFCLEVGGASCMAANDPRHPPSPDQTLLGGNAHQVHNQQVDPANGSVNLLNQTGNFAAELSNLEAGADPSIAENNEPLPGNNNSKYDLENVFMVGSQMISTIGAVSTKKSTSEMSSNAGKLWYFLLGCIFVSLIFWFYALLLFGRKRRLKAARFVMGIAYIATAFALLAVTGLQLPDEVMTWGTLGACILSLPAIIGYAMK